VYPAGYAEIAGTSDEAGTSIAETAALVLLILFHFLYLRTINAIITPVTTRQTMIAGMLITPAPNIDIIHIMGATANTPRTMKDITHDVLRPIVVVLNRRDGDG